PPSLPAGLTPEPGRARARVAAALARGERWLGPEDVAEVLAAYDIPAPQVVVAVDADAAARAALPMLKAHGAVALKIQSPDLPHKSAGGGVVLGLDSVATVAEAAQAMLERVARLRPEARIEGVLVQPMVARPRARELIAGIADDSVFGPVIL